MCLTVFGASVGKVSNSNVPFSVSTTMTGPVALAVGVAGFVAGWAAAGLAGVCSAGTPPPWATAIPAHSDVTIANAPANRIIDSSIALNREEITQNGALTTDYTDY